MWITVKKDADLSDVQASLTELGVWTQSLKQSGGPGRSLAILPHSAAVSPERLLSIAGIDQLFAPESRRPKVDAQSGQVLKEEGWTLGEAPILMAGPCGVESEEQIHQAAEMVAKAGATFLRGGAFKPRSSPYSFCGFGQDALVWLREAADHHGLKVVTELLSEQNVDQVAKDTDLIQIGSRNMQNFALLKAAGKTGVPVLLKRGMAATVEEWMLAGEHLLAAGSRHVVFCERGIQNYDQPFRNLLDLSAVALLKHVHKQLVVVDPSHGAGRKDLILPLSKAALAVGADGLLVEAHPAPGQARSDGPQALQQDDLNHLGALFEQSEKRAPTLCLKD